MPPVHFEKASCLLNMTFAEGRRGMAHNFMVGVATN